MSPKQTKLSVVHQKINAVPQKIKILFCCNFNRATVQHHVKSILLQVRLKCNME